MTRYTVLLRGINVGGHHRLAMADLRALLADAGLADPQTYLQSGQAFVTSDLTAAGLEQVVHDAIADATGLDLEVMAIGHARLVAVAEGNPFAPQAAADPTTVTAVFVDGVPETSRLDPDGYAPDDFVVGDGVVYLHTPQGMGRSRLGAFDWRRTGVRATARNWRTVGVLVDRTAAD